MTLDTPAGASARPVTVRRTFPFDRETVFRAWTDPDAMGRWFGGAIAVAISVGIDLRVGGAWHITVQAGGQTGTVRGVYHEVEPPERVVYTWAWDWTGEGPGRESLVTVEFNDVDGATEIVITHEGLTTEQSLAFHTRGWTDSLEGLAQVLG